MFVFPLWGSKRWCDLGRINRTIEFCLYCNIAIVFMAAMGWLCADRCNLLGFRTPHRNVLARIHSRIIYNDSHPSLA